MMCCAIIITAVSLVPFSSANISAFTIIILITQFLHVIMALSVAVGTDIRKNSRVVHIIPLACRKAAFRLSAIPARLFDKLQINKHTYAGKACYHKYNPDNKHIGKSIIGCCRNLRQRR